MKLLRGKRNIFILIDIELDANEDDLMENLLEFEEVREDPQRSISWQPSKLHLIKCLSSLRDWKKHLNYYRLSQVGVQSAEVLMK